jgi:hypothetical protein
LLYEIHIGRNNSSNNHGYATAHSSPAFSAGSRAAAGVPECRDVELRARRVRFLRAELMIVFGCCQSENYTAKWLRRKGGSLGAGRSRRPRRTRGCGAASTRMLQRLK